MPVGSLVRLREDVWLPKIAAAQRLRRPGTDLPTSLPRRSRPRLGTGAPPAAASRCAATPRPHRDPRDRLRPLTEPDLDRLIALQEAGGVTGLGHVFPQDTNPFPREQVAARWRAEIADPDTDALAVEVEGRLQGFVALRGEELLHFGTAVETWGTGLADDAHDLAVDRLAGRGVRTARLWVFAENGRALRLYERLGWRPTGRPGRRRSRRTRPCSRTSSTSPTEPSPQPEVQTAPEQSRESSASMNTPPTSWGF